MRGDQNPNPNPNPIMKYNGFPLTAAEFSAAQAYLRRSISAGRTHIQRSGARVLNYVHKKNGLAMTPDAIRVRARRQRLLEQGLTTEGNPRTRQWVRQSA